MFGMLIPTGLGDVAIPMPLGVYGAIELIM